MPASPRPRRLHHLGSKARIYIAQECTTRGPRRLHLHVQEHNSRYARPRRCPRRRELKKMPASPRHTRVERYARRPPCARPKDTRVGHVTRASASLRPPKSTPFHLLPLHLCFTFTAAVCETVSQGSSSPLCSTEFSVQAEFSRERSNIEG